MVVFPVSNVWRFLTGDEFTLLMTKTGVNSDGKGLIADEVRFQTFSDCNQTSKGDLMPNFGPHN